MKLYPTISQYNTKNREHCFYLHDTTYQDGKNGMMLLAPIQPHQVKGLVITTFCQKNY